MCLKSNLPTQASTRSGFKLLWSKYNEPVSHFTIALIMAHPVWNIHFIVLNEPSHCLLFYLLSQLERYDCVIFCVQDQNRTGYVVDTKRQTDTIQWFEILQTQNNDCLIEIQDIDFFLFFIQPSTRGLCNELHDHFIYDSRINAHVWLNTKAIYLYTCTLILFLKQVLRGRWSR